MSSKDIKCKCGHLRSEHTESWNTKGCNNCQCNSYLGFDRPNGFDRTVFIMKIIGVILTIVVVLSIHLIYFSVPEETLNETFDVSFSSMVTIIFSLVLIILVLCFVLWFDDFAGYFVEKNRRVF